jgi:hypothetical protein
VFQGRYKAFLVEDEGYYWNLSRYIHLNRWHSPFFTDQSLLPLTLWFTWGSGGGALKRSSQVGLVEQTAG